MAVHDPEKLKQKLFDFAKRLPLFQTIGFEVIDFGPGWAKTRIALRDELRNANGVMQGGVIATLVDATITQAMLMTDEYQRVRETKGTLASVDLHVKYVRPVTAGYAHCEAQVPYVGKRISHATAVVTNDEGKPVALGDSALLITLGDVTRT